VNDPVPPRAEACIELDPRRVKPFAGQPRKRFRRIKQLAESIRTVGQVTPIVVTACEEDGFDAELVDGQRRLEACLEGNMLVKAVVGGDLAAGDRYVRSVAANFCRQNHDAVEIMEAVLTMKANGRTTEEIGGVFGKTVSWVLQYASLRKLAPEVIERLKVPGDEAKLTRAQRRAGGKMTFSLALLLVPLPPSIQLKAMGGILAGKMGLAEARTFVHRLAAGQGQQVGKRVSPRGQFQAVSTAVANCSHVVTRYLDAPWIEIQRLLRTATRQERKLVGKQLETLRERLLMLSEEIKKP